MTDVEQFIDDFLQHDYDPVKAREYYLRTRKLKGRATKKVKQLADKAWETDKEYDSKVKKAAGALNRDRAQAKAAQNKNRAQARATRQERLLTQQRRIDQALEKTKKLPPTKRKKIESKINALQKRLKKSLVPGKVKIDVSNVSRPNLPDLSKVNVRSPRLKTGKIKIDVSGAGKTKLSNPFSGDVRVTRKKS